jgi:hypothetical protein
MRSEIVSDEALLQRLPLAQIYRRAHNAKTPLERHLTAFSLWEASLKLLASVAIVEYAQRREADPKLADRLQNLARPQLGHWWEFVRLLVPVLAHQGDAAFERQTVPRVACHVFKSTSAALPALVCNRSQKNRGAQKRRWATRRLRNLRKTARPVPPSSRHGRGEI